MKIFLDLDETLVHAMFKASGKKRVHVDIPQTQEERDAGEAPEWYGVIERPGAMKFIELLRQKYGRDNVFILTAATHEYAYAISEKFGWGFPGDFIIARGYYAGTYGPAHLAEKRFDSVLIDNMPRSYEWTWRKLNFLEQYGKPRLILEKSFGGQDTHGFTDKKIADILTQI